MSRKSDATQLDLDLNDHNLKFNLQGRIAKAFSSRSDLLIYHCLRSIAFVRPINRFRQLKFYRSIDLIVSLTRTSWWLRPRNRLLKNGQTHSGCANCWWSVALHFLCDKEIATGQVPGRYYLFFVPAVELGQGYLLFTERNRRTSAAPIFGGVFWDLGQEIVEDLQMLSRDGFIYLSLNDCGTFKLRSPNLNYKYLKTCWLLHMT